MKIYLAGQTNFGNRGCEALVRSSVYLIKKEFPKANILCPLDNIIHDKKQWPEAEQFNVEFITSPKFSILFKWWSRINRIIPIEKLGIPKFYMDEKTVSYLKESNVLIMTGGDNLTLDYGVMALFQWCSIAEQSIELGKPAILWAASVGPFNKNPDIEKSMVKHLNKYSAITVRESVSYNYLKSIGVVNVDLVADPAFCLFKEKYSLKEEFNDKNNEKLGFNVSPLIRKFRKDKNHASELEDEIIKFINEIIKNTKLNILLISHVDYNDIKQHNSDWQYLKNIYNNIHNKQGRVTLVPPSINASQVKYIIGECNYFIGARTHSTIAALSQSIPTISIAYSIKAIGINKDLFGHEKYVLNTIDVNAESLYLSLEKIIEDEIIIKSTLNKKLPQWKSLASNSVMTLKKCLDDK